MCGATPSSYFAEGLRLIALQGSSGFLTKSDSVASDETYEKIILNVSSPCRVPKCVLNVCMLLQLHWASISFV